MSTTRDRRNPNQLVLPAKARELLAMLGVEQLALLRDLDARLGGGTVLAARWGEHRLSTDLDIFIPAARFDDRFSDINAMQAAVSMRMQPGRTAPMWTNPKAGLMVIQCRMNDGRSIEFVRVPRLAPLGRGRIHPEFVHGTRNGLATLSTRRILAGKLAARAAQLAERDVYDLAYAAIHDCDNLVRALGDTNTAMVRSLRRALVNVTEAPRQEHKKVADPTWTTWRTEAPAHLRTALDEYLRSQTSTRGPDAPKTPDGGPAP